MENVDLTGDERLTTPGSPRRARIRWVRSAVCLRSGQDRQLSNQSLTLARSEVPVMVALRLFLAESWTSDQALAQACGCSGRISDSTHQAEIALAEIDRLIAAGVRFGCVLADACCGLSALF